MLFMQILAMTVVLFLEACAGRPAEWAPAESNQALLPGQIEADWPQGWMTLRPAESDEAASKEGLLFMVTRDGFGLQTIRMNQRPLEADFQYTHKKLSPDMLPQEVADLVLDNIRANPGIVDLKILENSPTTMAGDPAFKLTYTYRSKTGLLRQSIQYGCLRGGMLVTLSFDAPQRHYFSHDLTTFETVKTSMRWKS